MRDFMVELLAIYDTIARTQIGRLEPDLSADEVMSECEKVMDDLRGLRVKTDSLLREHLYPMLDNITELAEEDEQDLYATAQKMSSYAVRVDPGLALKIYQKLLECARSKKNDAKIIKYLYWCGITTFFFLRGQYQGVTEDETILAYFEEGAAYADRYQTFDDPETRQYIHRCLGNRSMICYNVHNPEKAKELEESNFSFWNRLLFDGIDTDFPWLNYFLACLNHRHGYLVDSAHTDPDSVTKAMLRDNLDISITVNKLYQKNRDSFSVFGGTRYDYMLWEAQFLSGLISFDHLYENISKRKEEIADDDFSGDALYVNVQLNSFLMFYAAKMRKLRDRKDEIVSQLSKEVIDYFSRIPMSVSPAILTEQLQFFAINLSDILPPEEQVEFTLKMTTFRHIQTYAHSIMVGKISTVITKHLIANRPDYFIGCKDITGAGDVAAKAEELCRFAETGSMCHDIGKISFISNPFMHTRVLTDEETTIVRQHPGDGAKLLMRDNDAGVNKGYIDVIMGHHKYYDNSGGYPEDYDASKSENKMMVDIISVANAIDASTDTIGRTHINAKSLAEICAEIKKHAGVRYSPVVAGSLDDEAVASAIGSLLKKDRKEAYYTAYLHSWGKGN